MEILDQGFGVRHENLLNHEASCNVGHGTLARYTAVSFSRHACLGMRLLATYSTVQV